jgi:hypothetical protein
MTLEPTEARVQVALRAESRMWTFGPKGPVEIETDPVLAEMVGAGLITPHYVSSRQQAEGRDDLYVLTEAGRLWLAAATADSSLEYLGQAGDGVQEWLLDPAPGTLAKQWER